MIGRTRQRRDQCEVGGSWEFRRGQELSPCPGIVATYRPVGNSPEHFEESRSVEIDLLDQNLRPNFLQEFVLRQTPSGVTYQTG